MVRGANWPNQFFSRTPIGDDRVLHVLVLGSKYMPFIHIDPIESPLLFLQLFRSFLQGETQVLNYYYPPPLISYQIAHHDLMERGILHRDINPNNLMVQSTLSSSQGVLIDLDFASRAIDPSISYTPCAHFTHSTPFLAIELATGTPQRHLYRYDLESFYWVLCWTVARCSQNYVDQHHDLAESLYNWHHGSWSNIRQAKRNFLQSQYKFLLGPIKLIVTHDLSPLLLCLQELTLIFKRAHVYIEEETERGRSPSDVNVTFEGFRSVLNSAILMYI